MADRRQSFRFRMPWGSSGHPSAQKTSQAPPPQPQAPPRPTTRSQSRSRSSSQPAAKSRGVSSQSRETSPSPSPPHLSLKTKAASQDSEAQPGPREELQPQSSPKLASQTQIPTEKLQPTAEKDPLSPPELTDPQKSVSEKEESKPGRSESSDPELQKLQPQSTLKLASEAPVPAEKLQPTQKDPLPPPESTELQESDSKEEKPKPGKSESSEKESQKLQPEEKSAFENESPTRKQSSKAPPPAAIPEKPETEKSDSSVASSKEPKKEDPAEEKEIVQDLIDRNNVNNGTEEPRQKSLTELLTSGSAEKTTIKDHPTPEQKITEKGEVPNGKDTSAPTLQTEIKDDISRFVQEVTTQIPKIPIDDKRVSVITLAGENRGASMQLGTGSAMEEEIPIHRGYRTGPDDTTDGERSPRERKPRPPPPSAEENPQTKTYININIQGSNNSIMFDSSISDRDPGVQLFLSRQQAKPTEESNRTGPIEAHKAEVSATPVQKMTYEPVVRRRCLRGLLMESSDSDPDNPEKPRRHGCRYACTKGKENEKDVS